MALSLSSLLAVPDGDPSLVLEDSVLYNTDLFSGDLSLTTTNGLLDQKASSTQPLVDDPSFLPSNDFWSSVWPSVDNIPDLSLLCEPEPVNPSFSVPTTPYPFSGDSPASMDVHSLSSPVSSPIALSPSLSPSLSPEEHIQNIIMYLEDDAPSSVESAPTHTPVLSPTTPLHVPTPSPTASPSPPAVPQKRSLYEESPRDTLPSAPLPKRRTVTQRKLRKKEQNKTAALRYRQRKKEELHELEARQQSLEDTNRQLQDKVGGLEAEIKYLKQLWIDISKARAN